MFRIASELFDSHGDEESAYYQTEDPPLRLTLNPSGSAALNYVHASAPKRAASPGEPLDTAMYRILLEQLPVVTFMARLGGEGAAEIYVSPQIEAMLGFSQDEWRCGPALWYERLHPDEKSRMEEEFALFLGMAEPLRSVYRFLARDGHIVWVQGDVRMLRDPDGQPTHVLGIGTDVTELKLAEEALKRTHDELERRTTELLRVNKALEEEAAERKRALEELQLAEQQLLHSSKLASLGTLASGVAHELNQPLTVIRGIAQQLQHEAELKETYGEDLDLIVGQTSRMTKIINHLRTFSRAPSGEIEAVDMNEVVRNCLILIGEQLRSRGIEVELSLSASPLIVQADANELEQVVLNLVTNARDVLEECREPRITLRSRRSGSRMMLEVCDNGPGVPQNLIDRIFDPFFTTKPTGKGTGLGLSISDSILTRYGGSLAYCTDNGAVFTMLLPAA